MADLCSYFVKDEKDLVSDPKQIIKGKTFRFTFLSPRCLRIEYNPNGIFEDRATALVVNRNFATTKFTATADNTSITVTTEYFTLKYVKEAPISGNNIRVIVNGTSNEWYPGNKEIKNIGSITYSLDDMDKNLRLDRGLYSLDGFCLLDDSKSFVIDKGIFLPREDGITDLYLMVYRNDLGLCLQDYFNLTGYPPMLPRYALGNWWYKNNQYNMYVIDDVIKNFDDCHIPISVFLLGNYWHNNIDNFDYDSSLFDKNSLLKYYNSKKQVFGLTINPELPINMNTITYNEIFKYLNNNGINNFIPLDNNRIMAYLNIVTFKLLNSGIKIFNIDYYNPFDRYGLFLLNHYHYTLANMKERGVILSRNPGIAPHRYPIIYSGKTRVSWDTLKNLAIYNNRLANMGVSWMAHAIGGYYGGTEEDELFLRYIQFGVFNPIFILAGEYGKYYKREPWRWNQIKLNVIREYMCLRNKLVPYIYNEGYMYHKCGVPLIQPLYYKYPKIYDEPDYVDEYFFGSKILISPIVKRKNIEMNRVIQKIFIPNGVWYDYSSGKKFTGNKYYVNFYKEEDYPIFIKEGSIIPMSLDNDTNIPINMELQIYPAENGLFGSYELYEDDGISLDVKDNYAITKMNLDKLPDGYKFTISRKSGVLKIPNRNYLLRFKNMKYPDRVFINHKNNREEIKDYVIEKNDLLINLKDISAVDTIEIFIIGNKLEIETISVINDEIRLILDDLEINTILKEHIDTIIFSDLPLNKKKIALKKLKKEGLEPKFINMFIGLLDFTV